MRQKALTRAGSRERPGALVALLQVVCVVSLIWTGFFLAWGTLRLVDFAYPALYQVLDIDAHIAQYGPQNRFKHEFESTSREQRLMLFGRIVDAIQANGQGLEDIRYSDRQGRAIPMLRQPEIVHLRSVARLVDRLAKASWAMSTALLLSLLVMHVRGWPPPRPGRVVAWGGGVVTAGLLFTLVYGPEKVFNTLHVWAFPAGEQWFFYYQESLMTTLMKAPDLFGAIAALWLLLALAYSIGMLLVCRYVLWRGFTPSRR